MDYISSKPVLSKEVESKVVVEEGAEDANYNDKMMSEHDKILDVKATDAKKLYNDLMEVLKHDEACVKIADIMPSSEETLKVILNSYSVDFNEKVVEELLDLVTKYSGGKNKASKKKE